jgi:hypothetical protein
VGLGSTGNGGRKNPHRSSRTQRGTTGGREGVPHVRPPVDGTLLRSLRADACPSLLLGLVGACASTIAASRAATSIDAAATLATVATPERHIRSRICQAVRVAPKISRWRKAAREAERPVCDGVSRLLTENSPLIATIMGRAMSTGSNPHLFFFTKTINSLEKYSARDALSIKIQRRNKRFMSTSLLIIYSGP